MNVDLSFSNLRFRYLFVYSLMVAGDWLQGPYIYALYDGYGYSRDTIAALFVVGFGSSMFLGTFIGSLADKWGRRRMALCYCLLYIISCITKHNKTLTWLVLGRLTGGAATSLLMSTFDSWLVKACSQEGKSDEYLSVTLSYATNVNSMVAIFSGLIAEQAVNMFPLSGSVTSENSWYMGGYTAPFDLAILTLALGGVCIALFWDENYGSQTDIKSGSVWDGLKTVVGDSTILAVGLAQGCFEGAMYCFVFMWTPAVQNNSDGDVALGRIFSGFMIACMVGSQAFGTLIKRGLQPEKILLFVFGVAAFALCLGPIQEPVFGTKVLQFYGFVLFEVCVGFYFPCMGTLKSIVVPEEKRSTIYNIYRIPLNIIVLGVLLSGIGVNQTFVVCSILLVAATALQFFVLGKMTYAKVPTSELP